MSDYYILDGHTPVPVEMMRWAKWFETADRKVAVTMVGDIKISTVFLGLDHSFGHGPPLLFETMIFGGPHDEDMARYSTWDEAEAGHNKVVESVKQGGGL